MDKKIVKSRLLSVALIGLGLALIFYGYQRGEAKVVLDKAVQICMECIGIG